MKVSLGRQLAAEFLGTGFLVATVIGSGIMGERLAGGNVAIALLANTIATGAALVALILAFGPISGAHFNPVVTLSDALEGGMRVEGNAGLHRGASARSDQRRGSWRTQCSRCLIFRFHNTHAAARRIFSANSSPPSGCCA